MSETRQLVLIDGVPTALPVDAWSLLLTVDHFHYGDAITPSKTPHGAVMCYLNGVLISDISNLDEIGHLLDSTSTITLAYLAE